MAIDSQDKRASAGSLLGLELLPLADGTVGASDRLQVAGVYAGIAAAAPTAAVHGPYLIDAMAYYVPGAACSEVHTAGSEKVEVFVAGAEAQEV